MPACRTLQVCVEEREALEDLRDHAHPCPSARRGRHCWRQRHPETDCDLHIVGRLDVVTGPVVTRRANAIRMATLVQCSKDVRTASPQVERISVVLDTWPVHVHPDVLAALEPRTTRWAFPRPGNRPATPGSRAVRRAGDIRLPIQRTPSPT